MHFCRAAAAADEVGEFLDQRFNYLARRRWVNAILAANRLPRG
jgi:hypothetical protein